ncbi:serine hydrolase domain-containing protein [Variovorax rhizosphaerae]|uniref:Serine hydrolase domain-containing protein n=1 Tax=Variovorax rhizosphaerae TaxID=1836200 RepID=A0ABU8WXG0_9BURK
MTPDSRMSRRSLLAACGAGATTSLAACAVGRPTPNWDRLDSLLAEAVAAKDAPFLVAAVSDRNKVVWQGAAGRASPNLKANQDVVLHLYSATKAIGSLACLILVDRGKLSLDTRVVDVLPEFRSVQVLVSMGPTGPVYRAPSTPVTLRHLLTHTSGLAYSPWDAKESAWEAFSKTPPPNVGTLQGFTHPLMFDPGTDWTYGVGIDWAGFMVEKVDGRTIDRFVREEIFEPLQMNDTMFETDTVARRLPAVKQRAADGGFTDAPFMVPPPRPQRYGMGQACHGTAADYLKFTRLVLNDGMANGRRILSANTMSFMKQNQIGPMRLPFPKKSSEPVISADLDLFPGLNIPLTHTAGFVRNEADVPGMRRAGSLTWAGILNTHYWIDPSSGIAAFFSSQHIPFIEPRFQKIHAAFEKAVYREMRLA